MKTIQRTTAKKIGLVSAISMLIGSTIGVGIFFKNGNVFVANDYNSIAIIIAWLISGIISICCAFSFAEVGTSKQSHSGLGGWYEAIIGKRSGKFIKIIQPFFYFIIIAFSISIFAGEAIFNIFDASDKVNFGLIMLVGFCFFIAFLFFNFFAMNASAKFQIVATSLKFIPLLMVIFAGIIYGSMNPNTNLFNNISTSNESNISFIGIVVSIPSILFAFDSFIGVGNLSLDMKKPKRNVPLSIVIGMVTVTVFYLLISIAQIMVGQGNVYSMFKFILQSNSTASNVVNIILSIFILVSIIGVLNAFSLVSIKSCQSLADENLIIGSSLFKNCSNMLFGTRKQDVGPGLLISITYYICLFILLLIPSAILNSDILIDGISNFPTTIFFGFYGTIILATLINRFTKKINLTKIRFFIPMAIIAIIGCYFVVGFQVFYTFLIQTILDFNKILPWGLFSSNGVLAYAWIGTLLMFLYLFSMILYYLFTAKFSKPNNSLLMSFRKEAYV